MPFQQLKKRKFLIAIACIILFAYFGRFGHWGINKTIGWGWEFTNPVFIITNSLWLIFPLGYGLLWILGCKTNRMLSRIQLILVFLCLIFTLKFRFYSNLFLYLSLTSFAIFIINMVWTITNCKRK